MRTLGWPEQLWLVRHAESNGNVADLAAQRAGAGRLDLDIRDPDVGLSPTGEGQAAALATWMGEAASQDRPTMALCSPYVRAASTAAIALDGLDVPIRFDERLRERDLGILDGYTRDGIIEHFPDEAERRRKLGKFYYRPPGGESWADVAGRVRSVVTTLRLEHAGQRVMVFSHQAVLLVFRYVLEGLSEQQVLDIDGREPMANAGVTTYRWSEGDLPDGMRPVELNRVAHVVAEGEPVTKEQGAHVAG